MAGAGTIIAELLMTGKFEAYISYPMLQKIWFTAREIVAQTRSQTQLPFWSSQGCNTSEKKHLCSILSDASENWSDKSRDKY